jgi:hypothetical protein
MSIVFGIDPEVVKARRALILDNAPCAYCGVALAKCKAERGKDPTAPSWFGCCAHGADLEPCSHRSDSGALRELLDEIESGNVRTVEQVLAERKPVTKAEYFDQREWWRQRSGEWIRVSEMAPGHRYNSAAMLMRNNPGAQSLIVVTTLYRALTEGLTIHGDGTRPWEHTGTDPVTGQIIKPAER